MFQPNNEPMFIVDKYYGICEMSYDKIVIKSENRLVIFSTIKNQYSWYVYDFFYTEEEIRKLKLKSLNHV